MKEYIKEYNKEHCNSGRIISETDYSFTFETKPDKNGKTSSYIVYESYFWRGKKNE